MFKGMKEMVTKEVRMYAPPSIEKEVNVIDADNKHLQSWIGGSVFIKSVNISRDVDYK